MILPALRGISKFTAGVTGLLLVYEVVYAMESMTTRIPNPWQELAITTLWMLPWTLLFCSGLEDFGIVTQKAWIFWVGTILALVLLYYFERNTTSTILTKAAMPVLAVSGGLLPHAIRASDSYSLFAVWLLGLQVFLFFTLHLARFFPQRVLLPTEVLRFSLLLLEHQL